jgi:CheY-like chemotaxis protein
LINLGYRVIETTDGNEAMRILQDQLHVDLLFTDLVMPGGMNGRKLALEAVRIRPNLKVLFCSG